MRSIILIMVIALNACGSDDSSEKSSGPESDQEAKIVYETGEKGDKGDKGDQGEKGEASGEVLPSNVWRDPITEKKWLIGSKGNWASLSYCSGEYKAPSYAEVYEAVMHGLLGVANTRASMTSFWSVNEYDGTRAELVNSVNMEPYYDFKAKTSVYGVVCIEN